MENSLCINDLPKYEVKTHIGVYFLMQDKEVVYIGSSNDIFTRVGNHKAEKLKIFDNYCFVECQTEILLQKELDYIVKYKPKYNKVLPSSNHNLVNLSNLCFADSKKIKLSLKPIFLSYYDMDECEKLLNKKIELKYSLKCNNKLVELITN